MFWGARANGVWGILHHSGILVLTPICCWLLSPQTREKRILIAVMVLLQDKITTYYIPRHPKP